MLTRAQMNGYSEERGALSGIVQAMLMTKHLLFVGFSLQDPNFGEVAGTVRSALRAEASGGQGATRAGGGAAPGVVGVGVAGTERSGASVGPLPVGGATVGSAYRRSGGGTFGTLLSLHNRPFLADLWPDVRCMPMDLTDAAMPHVMSNAACARTLNIFLDKLSLDASTTTRHLLDADFSGYVLPCGRKEWTFSPRPAGLHHAAWCRDRRGPAPLCRPLTRLSPGPARPSRLPSPLMWLVHLATHSQLTLAPPSKPRMVNPSGVFDPDELALRGHLMAFQERLRGNPEARKSSGYTAVRDTLRSLGARLGS